MQDNGAAMYWCNTLALSLDLFHPDRDQAFPSKRCYARWVSYTVFIKDLSVSSSRCLRSSKVFRVFLLHGSKSYSFKKYLGARMRTSNIVCLMLIVAIGWRLFSPVDHLAALKCCQPGSIDLIDCLLRRREQGCDTGVNCLDLELGGGRLQLNKQPESIVSATCQRSIVWTSINWICSNNRHMRKW